MINVSNNREVSDVFLHVNLCIPESMTGLPGPYSNRLLTQGSENRPVHWLNSPDRENGGKSPGLQDTELEPKR